MSRRRHLKFLQVLENKEFSTQIPSDSFHFQIVVLKYILLPMKCILSCHILFGPFEGSKYFGCRCWSYQRGARQRESGPLYGMIWLGILTGIGFALYPLSEIVAAFWQLSAFRKPRKLLRRAFLWTSKIISRQFNQLDFSTPTWAEGTVEIIPKYCPCLKPLIFLLCTNPIHLDRCMRRFGVHISVFSVVCHHGS